MAFILYIDPEQGIERVVYSGAVTEHDLAAAWQAMDEHPDHRLSHHLITDLRAAALHAVTPDTVKAIANGAAARYHGGQYRQGRTAILVNPEDQDIAVKLIKLYIAHLELVVPEIARRERIFAEEAEALAWLRTPV